MNLNLPLSSGAIAHLINKLNNMEAELQSKKEIFLDALADFGVRQIEQRIAKAASKPYNISVQTWADGSKSIVGKRRWRWRKRRCNGKRNAYKQLCHSRKRHEICQGNVGWCKRDFLATWLTCTRMERLICTHDIFILWW